jgi:hypothetical protein
LNLQLQIHKKHKQPTYTIEEKINRQNNGKFKKNDKANQLPDPILMDSAEAKFQNLISQAPVLIVTYYGPTFIIQTINKIALSVWKKSYDEVINNF